jgi:hypothetical protein
MPTFDKHCSDCRLALGEDFADVHRWLDEFFPTMGPKHRCVRHHAAGVEEVRRTWGDAAAEAAIIHIKADCKGKVPTEQEARISSLFS